MEVRIQTFKNIIVDECKLAGLCYSYRSITILGTNCAIFQFIPVSNQYGLVSGTCTYPAKRIICELPAGRFVVILLKPCVDFSMHLTFSHTRMYFGNVNLSKPE